MSLEVEYDVWQGDVVTVELSDGSELVCRVSEYDRHDRVAFHDVELLDVCGDPDAAKWFEQNRETLINLREEHLARKLWNGAIEC